MRTVVVLALLLAASAAAATGGAFTAHGVVTHVVDGDTLDVRLDGGRVERVRLIGIDAPETGDCDAAAATDAARALADGRRVALVGDPTQATRDRYGRLLAYVWLPGGRDLGFQLLAAGHARVYVYDRPFRRLAAYEAARARGAGKGMWRCGSQPTATATGGRCAPGYAPCLPVVRDLDCNEIPDRLKPIRVTGSDPYRLDGDGDGLGCE
jgi:endonuclease YncB( thermonuclease family)